MQNDLITTIQTVVEGIYNILTGDYKAEETKEEVHIIKKGRRITAAYFVNGKCIRHANAKCSKEDVFEFEYGSKLAFKRMWGDPNA